LRESAPLDSFTIAEDYHQKYYLRMNRIVSKETLTAFDHDQTAFRDSFAAARLNAYLGGFGSPERFERELPELGLSEAGADEVRRIIRRRFR
jgi:peptide-methionine (S)-S-oxide reductase